jgi:hypothetical protein
MIQRKRTARGGEETRAIGSGTGRCPWTRGIGKKGEIGVATGIGEAVGIGRIGGVGVGKMDIGMVDLG